MEYRILGKTGLKISRMGFGGIPIQRIEVHNNDKYDGHCHVKVDIYFTGVGLFERPTEQELQTLADMHEQNAG